MSRVTSSSMPDARDAEDRRLLESRDFKQLLANYLHTIRQRCAARIRDPYAADDVAQMIVLRLWRELQDGKHRGPTPFRVVVHNVIGWTIGGWFKDSAPHIGIPEGWDPPGPDGLAEWEERYDLRRLADALPDGQREVFELVYLDGLTPGEAADRLGIAPNAVYQRLHNAHAAVGRMLDA